MGGSPAKHPHRWSLMAAWTSLKRVHIPRGSDKDTGSSDESSKGECQRRDCRSKHDNQLSVKRGVSKGDKKCMDVKGSDKEAGKRHCKTREASEGILWWKRKGDRAGIRIDDEGRKTTVGKRRSDKRAPKKRVSFLLRKKTRNSSSSIATDSGILDLKNTEKEGKKDGCAESKDKMTQFRRALSMTEGSGLLSTSIENNHPEDKDSQIQSNNDEDVTAKAVKVTTEVDSETLKKLHNFARTRSMHSLKDKISTSQKRLAGAFDEEGQASVDEDSGSGDLVVGKICLEDFADHDSDYEFLDTQSFVSGLDGDGADWNGLIGREPSRLTWIGNEKDLECFFAETGLIDDIEIEGVEEVNMEDFKVSTELEAEWEAVGREHNDRCSAWVDDQRSSARSEADTQQSAEALDIRSIAGEFERKRSQLLTEAT